METGYPYFVPVLSCTGLQCRVLHSASDKDLPVPHFFYNILYLSTLDPLDPVDHFVVRQRAP